MLTLFRINYLTNLTYFPIFLHFVDFSKVAAASPLAAAATATADAAAAQLAAEPQPQIGLRLLHKDSVFSFYIFSNFSLLYDFFY